MKRVFILMLAFIFFCMPTVANATSVNEVLAIDEYELLLQEEAAKYDIKCEILEYDKSKTLTYDMLARDVERMKENADTLDIRVIDVFTDDSLETYRAQFIDRNLSKAFMIYCAYGEAAMRLDTNVTVNLNNSSVVYVNSASAYQFGGFINFVSWTPSGISWHINTPSSGSVRYHITGLATFSYADPVTGITTGYTMNVNRSLDVVCI